MLDKSLAQEAYTGYMGVITSDHAYIHKGIGKTIIIDLGSISAATRIGFTTPTVASDKVLHWRPLGVTTSANYVEIKMTEDDSFTGGTDKLDTIFCRHRAYGTTTAVQAFKSGVTSTPTGLVVQQAGVGSAGAPRARSGGTGGADEELVLLQDTDYVITLTPSGATAVILSLFWYEEETFNPNVPHAT